MATIQQFNSILENLRKIKQLLIVNVINNGTSSIKINENDNIRLKYLTTFIQATDFPYNDLFYSTNTFEHDVAIVTAGKSFIYGYGKRKTWPPFCKPAILFDDFTTDCKYIDIPFYFPSSAGKIILNNRKADLKWLYYVIQSLSGVADNKDHGRHWLEVFCNVKVPNIPLKDQQSISRYLDEKIKYLDEKIKSTLSLKENLEKLKLQLVKNLFSVHNKTIRLKFIASIVKGEQINQALFTKDGSGYPFANGGKDYSGFYSSYNNEACSVSMSEGGEYAGTILWNTGKFWSGGHNFTFKPLVNITQRQLYWMLYSKYEGLRFQIAGDKIPNLNKEILGNCLVSIPNADEVKYLESKIEWINSRIRLIGGENE